MVLHACLPPCLPACVAPAIEGACVRKGKNISFDGASRASLFRCGADGGRRQNEPANPAGSVPRNAGAENNLRQLPSGSIQFHVILGLAQKQTVCGGLHGGVPGAKLVVVQLATAASLHTGQARPSTARMYLRDSLAPVAA